MEIRIKKSVNTVKELEEVVQKIKKIEEEYNCHCTLLEIEITH